MQPTPIPHPRVTVDDVMSWSPCGEYTRERVEQLFAGRETLTELDILELDIPVEDRFWAVLRPEFISERDMRLFAADCAEHVLHLFERDYPDDKRARQAIEAARAYARGILSIEELAAARDAAMAAAWAAARGAARAAAWAAARGAARAAAQKWQIERLAQYLRAEVSS